MTREMSSTKPFVSVVIPCRNELGYIEPCIESVLRQDLDGSMEIIVADGMSDDGTRETLQEVQHRNSSLRVVDNPRRIASTGLNRAVAIARGEVIVRIDVHTHYPSDYISRCIKSVAQGQGWTVGGPQVATSDTLLGRSIAAAYQSPFAVGAAKCHFADYEGPVDHIYLGCWKRETFDQTGGFDSALIRNQDVELDLRVAAAGGVLWQSRSIKCRYQVRRTLQALFFQNMQFGYWKIQVVNRHPLQFKARHLIPPLFILALAFLAFASPFVPAASLGVAVVLGLYGAFVAAGTLKIALDKGLKVGTPIPLVLPCYHFGYGYGMLRGLWDHSMGRDGASASFARLTR